MSDWMSCDEEMPIFLGVPVLVYTVHKRIKIMYLSHDWKGDTIWSEGGSNTRLDHVTHWRLLPPHPRPEVCHG